MVKLYVKESCFRCDFMEKWLRKKGIAYSIYNIEEESSEKLQSWRDSGLLSAPIIDIDGRLASGADVGFVENNISQ